MLIKKECRVSYSSFLFTVGMLATFAGGGSGGDAEVLLRICAHYRR